MSKPAEQTIEYTISLDDAINFAWYTLKRNRTLYYLALFILAIYAFSSFSSFLSGNATFALGNLLIGVLSVLIMLLSFRFPNAMALIGLLIALILISTNPIGNLIVIPLVILSTCSGWFYRQYLKFYFKDKKAMIGLNKLRLSKEGLWCKTSFSEGIVSLTTIADISQTKDYIFIFLNKHQAFIIPKNSFNDLNNLETFYKLLVELWKKPAVLSS